MSRDSGLWSVLRAPAFERADMARLADTLQTILLPLFGASLFFAIVAPIFLPGGIRSGLIAVAASLPLLLCAVAARLGYPQAAVRLIVGILWLIAALDVFLGGGVSAPGQSVFILSILMAAFLLDGLAAVCVTAMALVATGVAAWLEQSGALPPSMIEREPTSYWMAQVAVFLASSGLVLVALRRIRGAVNDANRSQGLHRLVAESALDFIWRLDADRVFTYASPACEEILGFTPEEMLGKEAQQSDLPPDAPDIGALVQRALEQGRDEIRYEAQQRRKDGSWVWCEFRVRLLKDEEGAFAGLNGVTRDISERKRAEHQNADLEAQLRQSQKMEAIGQLAGGIAHDFNNYLTVILGNAELLAMETGAEKGSPLIEIDDAATRSAELTQQLLAFSRKQVLRPVVLDLNRVIRDADRLLRRVLGEDVSIETISAGGLGSVEVDPNQLEQVILNLAVNARAAMPDGGKLTIETGNVYLDSEYADRRMEVDPGRYVMLAVSDNGSGMDEATRNRVFEPFFTTKEQGSGLGLATVHGIVKQSGGTIGVYSEPGEGTTFRIYLPRIDSEPAVTGADDDVSLVEEERGSETILVVEDQEMVRRLIQRMLEARGFRVLLAADRDEAIALVELESETIDLLLTDIVLPGTSGVELARELIDRLGLKVLYMSGFTENGIVHRGILDPAHLLLQKPFTSHRLMEKIREALDA